MEATRVLHEDAPALEVSPHPPLREYYAVDTSCRGLTTQCAQCLVGPTGHVIGLDPSAGMLHEARKVPPEPDPGSGGGASVPGRRL
jgi:hypothetical protein